ncbi:MAG TPA: hypothetical protein VMU83_23815 [Hanamia sp.]|nr:hypothetical protein [Hanamia sp.]
MIVYIPYGVLCIAITIIIMNGFKKVRENKKTNRIIRNSERLQNTIAILQMKKKKEEGNPNPSEQ